MRDSFDDERGVGGGADAVTVPGSPDWIAPINPPTHDQLQQQTTLHQSLHQSHSQQSPPMDSNRYSKSSFGSAPDGGQSSHPPSMYSQSSNNSGSATFAPTQSLAQRILNDERAKKTIEQLRRLEEQEERRIAMLSLAASEAPVAVNNNNYTINKVQATPTELQSTEEKGRAEMQTHPHIQKQMQGLPDSRRWQSFGAEQWLARSDGDGQGTLITIFLLAFFPVLIIPL